MKRNAFAFLVLGAVLLVAGAVGVSATPVGTAASVTSDLAKYFTDQGVDAKYLNVDPSSIPGPTLGKINDILSAPDDTVNAILWHTNLTSLIGEALAGASKGDYQPVYLRLGSSLYTYESGTNPYAGVENPVTVASIAPGSWVNIN